MEAIFVPYRKRARHDSPHRMAETDSWLHRLDFRAMGSGFSLLVASNDLERSRTRLDAAWAFIQLAERTLSRFNPNSELSRLNARQGEPVPVSPILMEVMLEALDAAERSSGLYDPSVLPALELCGYKCDFQTILQTVLEEGPGDVCLLASLGSWREIVVKRDAKTVKLPAGTRIDLGGIAKGWTAERAADILAPLGPCLVDAGGDIAVRNRPFAETRWRVGVADPTDPDNDLAVIELEYRGVATSGVDFHKWQQGGFRRHHIIDPRSGSPATTDILTATVVAPDAIQAEFVSLAALVLGSQQGLRFLEAYPEADGTIVTGDSDVLSTSGFADYVTQSQSITESEDD